MKTRAQLQHLWTTVEQLSKEFFCSRLLRVRRCEKSRKLFWNDLMRNDQNSKFTGKQISNFKNFLLKHLMCVLWTSSVTVISTLYRKSLSKVWGNISSTKFSESNEQRFNIVRMSLSSKSVFCHLVCTIASRSIYKATTKLHIYLSMTFQQCQNIDFCFL